MAEKGAGEKSDTNGTEILEEIRMMCEKVIEKQNEQHILLKNSTEKQVKELQLIRGRMEEVERKLDAKKDNSEDTESIETDEPMDTEKDLDVVKEPITGKTFVLKHTFKEVLSMEANKRVNSSDEEHFGVPWKMYIYRRDEYLAFYVYCILMKPENWSIEIHIEVEIVTQSGKHNIRKTSATYKKSEGDQDNWGWPMFIKWDELEKEYLIDGNLTIEAKFKIKSMTGIYKNDLRCFDESTKDVSDIVLIVNEKKFYSSKLYLSAHSSYFKSMFLGQFGESKKSQITLTGIDSDDFQKYLEVLYAESAIDEFTVEGLLLLADMYDTKLVMRKCEEFLLKETKKSSKTKLRIAFRYNLNELKKKCLSDIKTVEEIRSVIPADINDLDPSITSALLEKCLALK